jgi:hypothetical protein
MSINAISARRLAVVLAFGAIVTLPQIAAAAGSQAADPTPIAATAAETTARPLPPAAQQFLAAVRANFAQWDLNHDGTLTREEIETAMQNPRYVGEAAAALAALKLGSTKFNQLHETRSFAPVDFDVMQRLLAAGQKLDTNFVLYFTAGLKKIAQQPRQLFAEGTPRLTAIRQDFTSDCYFLSAAGAVAQMNPQAIVRLIARNRDGSFTVSFPGQPPTRVTAPTEAEIATYTISKDGIWLAVLQKAFATLRIRMEPDEAATREPMDSVGFRTGSTRVMELFTGHPSRAILLPTETHQPADARLITQMRGELAAAFRERRAVTASSSHHAYAVVAYDPDADLVTVHNPYGRGGFETWLDGGKVALTEEGFFVIPTARLVGSFSNIRFEQGGHVGS